MVTKASAGVLGTAKYGLESFKRKSATDYTDAFSDWIDYLATENAVGELPNGDFQVEQIKTVEQIGLRMGIIGKGASSRILLPAANTTGALDLHDQSRDAFYLFSDFQILRTGGSGGTGLKATMVPGGVRHSSSHMVRNVRVSTEGEPGTAYFDQCMDFSGSWHAKLVDFEINGPGVGSDTSAGSAHYLTAMGLRLDSAYRPTLRDFSIWSCYQGIESDVYRGLIVSAVSNGAGGTRLTLSNSARAFTTGFEVIITGTTDYNGQHIVTRISDTEIDIPVVFTTTQTGEVTFAANAEDFSISGGHIVNVWNGINAVRPNGREPLFHMSGRNHINFVEKGISLDGWKTVSISGLVSYNEDGGGDFVGTPYDIHLQNVSGGLITGNRFEFDGNPNRVPVKVENDGSAGSGDTGIMTNNIMTGSGVSMAWLASGVSGWTVMGNDTEQATLSGAVVTDIDLANIVQTDDKGRDSSSSWVPVLELGGDSTGITYSTQIGTYRIDGKTMHYNIELALTSKGSAAGIADVSFPSDIIGPYVVQQDKGYGCAVGYGGMTGMASPSARPVSSDRLRLFNQGALQTDPLVETNFSDTTRIILSGSVEIG